MTFPSWVTVTGRYSSGGLYKLLHLFATIQFFAHLIFSQLIRFRVVSYIYFVYFVLYTFNLLHWIINDEDNYFNIEVTPFNYKLCIFYAVYGITFFLMFKF